MNSSPPPPAALAPQSVSLAEFDGEDGEVRLVFNTTAEAPLSNASGPGGADPLKWTARFDGVLYVGTNLVTIDFQTLSVILTASGAGAGADVINYANAPSDISDALGRQLAAFAGFVL